MIQITRFFLLLLGLGFSASAQVRGVVKDSLTNQPIPFVSIWVENQNIGTTSEENGSFRLETKGEGQTLVFSSLGYQKKKVKNFTQGEVKLSASSVELEEMVISNWKGTKLREIGEVEDGIHQAFDNAPNIDLKYFPYQTSYKKTKFIKKVSIYTDSQIEGASIKLHFYKVDANGFPGEEMLAREYIVPVKKGVGRNSFNVSKLGLSMPSNGIYVGFEKLMIESNRTGRRHYPLVMYNYIPKDFVFIFSGEKWTQKVLRNNNEQEQVRAFEPAINLTLTN